MAVFASYLAFLLGVCTREEVVEGAGCGSVRYGVSLVGRFCFASNIGPFIGILIAGLYPSAAYGLLFNYFPLLSSLSLGRWFPLSIISL